MAVYVPLSQEIHEVRLVRFDPSTSPVFGQDNIMRLQPLAVSLEVSPKYSALSYVWGDADSGSFIHVDGAKVPVRLNLFVALEQLYDHQVQSWLWIDALCINQNDDTERSWQVGLMRQIFARAEVVYISLGTQRDDSDLAMHILEKIGNLVLTSKSESKIKTTLEPFDCGSAPHTPVNMDRENLWTDISNKLQNDADLQNKRPWVAIGALLHRCYFSRVWVVQEVALAQRGVVMSGGKTTSLELFELAIEALDIVRTPRELSATYFHLMALEVRQKSRLSCKIPLLSLLQHFSRSPGRPFLMASDPRDLVYGVLGVATDMNALEITADYEKTVAQVFTEATAAILLHDQSYTLDYCKFPKDTPNLPSWVPDWTRIGRLGIEVYPLAYSINYKISDTLKSFDTAPVGVHDGMVNITGSIVDTVTRVMPPLWQENEIKRFLGPEEREEWLEAIFRFAGLSEVHSTCEDAWFRTLVAGCSKQGVRTNETWSLIARKVFRGVRITGETFTEDEREYLNSTWKDTESDLSHDTIDNMIVGWAGVFRRGRTLFQTKTGLVGLGPAIITEGDIITILAKEETPTVLRPRENDRYSYVGDTYVDGIMDGELVVEESSLRILTIV
ncbi:putative Heterokaryon incompatibility domain-containing protein [Seiridium unicorne]|uniref:Heterokaryon incompatibility domain-containing protein n=1 Tax=Seiridium unicorne TaxID=138068 RepID=A0ABR2UGN0_9PEZI